MALILRDPFRTLRLRNELFDDLLRDFFRGFDLAKATAELKNGVLMIRLPKSRRPKAHQVVDTSRGLPAPDPVPNRSLHTGISRVPWTGTSRSQVMTAITKSRGNVPPCLPEVGLPARIGK
jgi:hypothetical protein